MAGHDSNSPAPPRTADSRWFVTTHWSVVLAAGEDSSPASLEAMEQLCRTYWYPLYAYVRRQGNTPEDAQDLTQSFFAGFLARNSLSQVRREKGRFRSFLLASLRHFLSDERDRARALKRGGGQPLLSLDAQDAEGRYRQEPVDELNPEKIFERRWALTVLDRARAALQAEYAASGHGARFAVLERFLPGEQKSCTYADAATELSMAPGTVKWHVHQFKRRYRELLRAEIAHTVATADQIDEEARHLMAILGG